MDGQASRSPVVGVDLGGTKVLAAVVDAENRVLSRSKRSTPARQGNQAVLETIVEAVREALDEASVSASDVVGIGVGSPGPLDPVRGIIPFSPNIDVKDFALADDLSRALGRPVLLENDVSVGGYGEFRLGAGEGYRDLVCAFVGTGIGGCLILDGHLRAGVTGNAGEIGHMVVKAKGPRCGCGQEGCLEALASRTAVTRRIRKAIRKGMPSALSDRLDPKSDKIKSKDLAAAFHAGDSLVVREIHRSAHYLGLALGGIVNLLSPQLFIIGGGVVEALGQPYVDRVAESARAQTLADPSGQTRYALSALGDDAGILGASLLARERFAARG